MSTSWSSNAAVALRRRVGSSSNPPVAPGERKGSRVQERDLPAARQVNRFETEILTSRKNLKSLMDVPGKWIERIRRRRSLDKLILDLNSSVSQTYGRQERWHHLWCEGAAEHPNRVSVVVIIRKS